MFITAKRIDTSWQTYAVYESNYEIIHHGRLMWSMRAIMKQQTVVLWNNNMDGSHQHYFEWKNTDTGGHCIHTLTCLCICVCVSFRDGKTIYSVRIQVSSYVQKGGIIMGRNDGRF